jgi:DSF synthase
MLGAERYDSPSGLSRSVEPADALRHRANQGGLMFAPTESGTDDPCQHTRCVRLCRARHRPWCRADGDRISPATATFPVHRPSKGVRGTRLPLARPFYKNQYGSFTMDNLVNFPTAEHPSSSQASIHVDSEAGASILAMHPTPRPSFTPGLLADIDQWRASVADLGNREAPETGQSAIRYAVLTSAMPGIFNFGGDLNRFVELIRAGDRDGLMEYALACIHATHSFSCGFGAPVTSIALVQGRAQGGGFEAALAANVLIAERGTQMGFPEVLFNLFPGMGAYSFLSRKIAPSIAERLILSGTLYEAEDLYDMGVVDVLAEAGEGEQTLRAYMRDADKHHHVHGLMNRIRETHNHVPFEELRDITELWVDSALRLDERNIRTMERLVRAQDRRIGEGVRQAN